MTPNLWHSHLFIHMNTHTQSGTASLTLFQTFLVPLMYLKSMLVSESDSLT